jgi:hypothetical protein
MVEEPMCPFCGALYNVAILTHVRSIQIQCPECESIYTFTPGAGSFPVEEDLSIHVSRGRLGSRISIGQPVDSFESATDSISRVFCYICGAIVFILIIATLVIVFLQSRH